MKPIKPMLLTKGTANFCEDFLYEFKFDGVRMLGYNFEQPMLFNRNLNERTHIYREITMDLARLPKGIVLDGEVIAINAEGKPDFYLTLQRDLVKSYRKSDISVCFIVFDILFFEGKSVMDMVLTERIELLRQVLSGCNLKFIKQSDVFSDGLVLFDTAKRLDMEGIVAKRRDSIYVPNTRSSDWLKVKCFREITTVVGGFFEMLRPSLCLGLAQEGRLFYVGNVSNGLSEAQFSELLNRLKQLETELCPFEQRIKGARYVSPKINVVVRYLERTPSGTLRQPVIIKVY